MLKPIKPTIRVLKRFVKAKPSSFISIEDLTKASGIDDQAEFLFSIFVEQSLKTVRFVKGTQRLGKRTNSVLVFNNRHIRKVGNGLKILKDEVPGFDD